MSTGRARSVKLLRELDSKLCRYAELHGLTVKQAIAEAVEEFLRERAEIRMRIAEARLTAQRHNPLAPSA